MALEAQAVKQGDPDLSLSTKAVLLTPLTYLQIVPYRSKPAVSVKVEDEPEIDSSKNRQSQ